jgi:putative transposase
MREADLLAPSRTGPPRGPRTHDGTIIPAAVDTTWGADLTTTWTGEGQAAALVAVDHCSAECVGIHAAHRARHPLRGARAAPAGRAAPLRRLRQGQRPRLVRPPRPRQPVHGARLPKGARFLGVESSPAFVRAPEGSGCAERFIRTLKENLWWLRSFETVGEPRRALLAFRELYNATRLIERHGFRPPAAIRNERLSAAAMAA